MLDKSFFDLLVCPICKNDLQQKNETLICLHCSRYFEIKNGVPILLEEESIPLK